MAGSFVVGLGAGVIILLILWTLVLIAWVQLSSQQARLRTIITTCVILITIILLLIPTADYQNDENVVDKSNKNPDLMSSPLDAFQVYDYMFIWKGKRVQLTIFGKKLRMFVFNSRNIDGSNELLYCGCFGSLS